MPKRKADEKDQVQSKRRLIMNGINWRALTEKQISWFDKHFSSLSELSVFERLKAEGFLRERYDSIIACKELSLSFTDLEKSLTNTIMESDHTFEFKKAAISRVIRSGNSCGDYEALTEWVKTVIKLPTKVKGLRDPVEALKI